MGKSSLLVVVLVSVLLSGCAIAPKNASQGGAVTHGTSTASNSGIAGDDLSSTQRVPDPLLGVGTEYSNFSGTWRVMGNDTSGTSLNITTQANMIKGMLSSVNTKATHVANITFEGIIEEDKFTYPFQDDGWQHSGVLTLTFKQADKIGIDIKIDNPNNGQQWGITQGNFDLELVTSDLLETEVEELDTNQEQDSVIPQPIQSQASLLTYKDANLAYSFDYPSIFSTMEQASEGNNGVILFNSTKDAKLTVYAKSVDATLDAISRDEVNKHKDISFTDGQTNYFILTWQDAEMVGNTKLIMENGTLYFIQLEYLNQFKDIYQPHFNTVISSFKTLLDSLP